MQRCSVISLTVLALILSTVHVGAAQHRLNTWQEVAPGLYKRSHTAGSRNTVEYRARGYQAERSLATLLLPKHPKDAGLFWAASMSATTLLRVDGSSCTGSADGLAGTEEIRGDIRVTCATGVSIVGMIGLNPPFGSVLKFQTKAYSASGSLSKTLIEQALNCNRGDICSGSDPDSWTTTESWTSSDGGGASYCQSGPDASC
jgi:hypothetical protein